MSTVSASTPIDLVQRVYATLPERSALGRQRLDEGGEALDQQRRVGLARRAEVLLHPEVDPGRAQLEPAPAPPGELRRLRHFREAERIGVELARRRLATGGHRQLDVIDATERGGFRGVAHLY